MHGKFKFLISKLFWLILITLAFIISVSLTRFFMEKGIDWNWAMFFYFNEYWVYIAIPFVLLGFIVPPAIVFHLYRLSKNSKSSSPKILFKRSLWALLTSYVLLIILKLIVHRTRIIPFEKLSNIGQSREFWFNIEQNSFGWQTVLGSWPSGHAMVATALAAALLRHLTSSLGRNLLMLYTLIISLSVSTAFNWMSDVAIGIIIGLFIGGYVREKEFKVK
jgi:membrane-associated phospholipid phosphatase